MKPNSKDLSQYAVARISEIYTDEHDSDVLSYLQSQAALFHSIKPEHFSKEFLAARLALASLSWGQLCEEYAIKEPGAEKIFFKSVMSGFQSPKYKDIASAFGDYLYAPETEGNDSPILAIVQRLCKRLEISKSALEKDPASLRTIFFALTEVAEGFRTEFENGFFEFLHSGNK